MCFLRVCDGLHDEALSGQRTGTRTGMARANVATRNTERRLDSTGECAMMVEKARLPIMTQIMKPANTRPCGSCIARDTHTQRKKQCDLLVALAIRTHCVCVCDHVCTRFAGASYLAVSGQRGLHGRSPHEHEDEHGRLEAGLDQAQQQHLLVGGQHRPGGGEVAASGGCGTQTNTDTAT